ncbi:hypothetical protein JCM14469_25020 [Desulfatiferula olefinivorans]
MKCMNFLWIPVIALCVGTAGCVTGKAKDIPSMRDAFKTRAEQSGVAGPETDAGTMDPERPIVRIITGQVIESPEEAARLLEQTGERSPAGPMTRLRSVILRKVPVRVIAELLTDLSGVNVVATRGVSDRPVSLYLKDLSVGEALDALCRLNDIWYRQDRGVMTLMSREEFVSDTENRQSDQTRAFFIRYTNAADMAKVIQSAMGDQVHLAVIDDEKIYGHIDPEEKAEVGGSSDEDLALKGKAALDGSIASGNPLLSVQPLSAAAAPAGDTERDKPLLAILTVFKRNNCILARSLDVRLLDEMEKIVETLDTPTSQVLLEIKILQLTLDDGFESFFEFSNTDTGGSGWFGAYQSTIGMGGSSVMGANTLSMVLNSDHLNARIRYFKTEGRAETVSTPFLMAANNSKVEFFVGEETPLRDDVTTSTVSLGENNVVTTFEVEIVREELGTDVEMTTFINEDGTVTLEFEAKIDSAILNYSTVGVVNDRTGDVVQFPLDGTSKSEIKSILTAASGQSIAIGGIIKETLDLTDNKVPILADIPLLGFFFKETKKTRKKTETVIVLTPHVIDHPARGGRVTDDFLGRKSSHQTITRNRENILAPLDAARGEGGT